MKTPSLTAKPSPEYLLKHQMETNSQVNEDKREEILIPKLGSNQHEFKEINMGVSFQIARRRCGYNKIKEKKEKITKLELVR